MHALRPARFINPSCAVACHPRGQICAAAALGLLRAYTEELFPANIRAANIQACSLVSCSGSLIALSLPGHGLGGSNRM